MHKFLHTQSSPLYIHKLMLVYNSTKLMFIEEVSFDPTKLTMHFLNSHFNLTESIIFQTTSFNLTKLM